MIVLDASAIVVWLLATDRGGKYSVVEEG